MDNKVVVEKNGKQQKEEERDTHKKRDKEMEDVLDAVIEEVAQLLNAQTAVLMTVDHEKGELVTKATAKGIDE